MNGESIEQQWTENNSPLSGLDDVEAAVLARVEARRA